MTTWVRQASEDEVEMATAEASNRGADALVTSVTEDAAGNAVIIIRVCEYDFPSLVERVVWASGPEGYDSDRMVCPCPAAVNGGFCWHMAAALEAIELQGTGDGPAIPDPVMVADALAGMPELAERGEGA
jgi:hypothetical protein